MLQMRLIVLSVVLFMIAAGWLVVLACWKKESLRGCLLRFMLCFFPSIWCMKLAAGLYLAGENPLTDPSGLTFLENIFDSAVHSLQAFSMDEDYTLYLLAGKHLCTELTGSERLSAVLGIFISVQNIIAPIVGGAILLDLLCNFFPRLKLLLQMGKKKYVFSELNEKTLCLAESIHSSELLGKNACILFTDVYVDGGNEKLSELLQRAKQIGAICLKDDLSAIRIRGWKPVSYILSDADEMDNLKEAYWISQNYRQLCRHAEDIDIYCFSQDYNADSIVEQIYRNGFEGDESEKNRVVIKVVQDATSLIFNLLNEQPLYLPLLLNPKQEEKLSILVVGSGAVAREMLAVSYWCGQICSPETKDPIPLSIHVIDENAKSKLQKELELRMPGIRFDGTDPYCEFHFHECSMQNSDVQELFENTPELYRVNYVLVALEDDAQNLDAAAWIRRTLETHNLTTGRKVVLNYLIEDPQLSHSLNLGEQGDEISCFHAFGNIADRFSAENILAPRLEILGAYVNKNHNKAGVRSFRRDGYFLRSSCAPVLHASYKTFSADRELFEAKKKYLKAGKHAIEKAVEKNRDMLAFLEHRRWSTYMLSIGFQCPSQEEFDSYFYQEGRKPDSKDRALKLHPSIVSSTTEGPRIRLEDWDTEHIIGYDALDNFSLCYNQMLRKKCRSDWAVVQARWEDEILPLLETKLNLDDKITSFSEIDACRDLLKAAGLTDMQATLAVPTNHKLYDYGQLDLIAKLALVMNGSAEGNSEKELLAFMDRP